MNFLLLTPIILLGGIILFLYLIQRYAHLRGLRLVLIGYISILLVASIVYYFLPDNDLINETLKKTGRTSGDYIEEDNSDVYNAAMDGTIDQLEEVSTVKVWNLTFLENELDVSTLNDFHMFTVFERKDSDDDLIEIIYYATNTEFLGVDLTEKVQLPTVSLEGKILNLINRNQINSDDIEIKFSTFHKDFVISQFKGGGISEDFEMDIVEYPLESEVLYIRIPKSLELVGSEYIDYVK